MKSFAKSLAIIVIFVACGKSGSNPNPPPGSTPAASINDVKQERGTINSTFHFSVTLSKAATQDVTMHYATAAGSAVANTDFVPVSGTLTIAAGKTSGSIDVEVKGDSTRKDDQEFSVQLSEGLHCTFAQNQGTGTIVNANGLYFPVDNTGYTTPDHYAGYTLKWSDDFNGNTITDANWGFESGNNNGWGNHELENYTNSSHNAFVSQGNLIIEARHEDAGSNHYTSARMITKGKQSFKYGRIDIRAKLPKGKGVWPALWLLGDNIDAVSWPACGEIDMMELLGQEPNKVYGTLHWGANAASHSSKGGSYVMTTGSFDQEFHVYSLIWTADSLNILVDDHKYFGIAANDIAPSSPFDDKFFLVFNVAVGGDWPGAPDGSTTFPQRMVVDYVRVFQ